MLFLDMKNNHKKPLGQEELDALELEGLWKAQSFSRNLARKTNEKITLENILKIHFIFFKDAIPDIAGRFRKPGEDIKKLNTIEPVLGSAVQQEMYKFSKELNEKISIISLRFPQKKYEKEKWFQEVLDLAAWIQYKITAIHPFVNGNGRMARMMTNVILCRFGLFQSNIHYEGVDKKKYIQALSNIDLGDNYELLKVLIARSMQDTYKKAYEAFQNQKRKK